jgi:sugar (pentulose or hexulose) kinase
MGHGHYVRAILESIAAGLYDRLLHAGSGTAPARVVATGGGARSDLWLQIKADMTGATFVRAPVEEPAAFGAAIMAAHAAGWYATIDETAAAWKSPGRAFVPDPVRHTAYTTWYEKHRSEWTRT